MKHVLTGVALAALVVGSVPVFAQTGSQEQERRTQRYETESGQTTIPPSGAPGSKEQERRMMGQETAPSSGVPGSQSEQRRMVGQEAAPSGAVGSKSQQRRAQRQSMQGGSTTAPPPSAGTTMDSTDRSMQSGTSGSSTYGDHGTRTGKRATKMTTQELNRAELERIR